jgi:hypothetical protein
MPAAPRDKTEELYRLVQKLRGDLKHEAVGEALTSLYETCLEVLATFERVDLTTRLAGKKYFAFESSAGKISRAVNKANYHPRVKEWTKLLAALKKQDFSGLDEDRITKTIYSVAISFCAVIDLTRSRDQKTPGTFFEYLIGHLFASRLGVNPTTRLPVLNLGIDTTLPTDYVFDLGNEEPKFHLPIKTSTRERIVQVWAHQRVLDGVYGTGRFLGTPVVLAETKTDTSKREVVEICLPAQWRIYQMHIAQLKRIYYLDVPVAYAKLKDVFPPLYVAPFGRFFIEVDELGSA